MSARQWTEPKSSCQARQKSNVELHRAIANRLGVAAAALHPKIRTVKRGEGRGKGSLSLGSRWLFNAMQTPGRFNIHPRCVRMITALDRYTMVDDEYKDPVDSLRYGLDRYIFAKYGGNGGGAIRVR